MATSYKLEFLTRVRSALVLATVSTIVAVASMPSAWAQTSVYFRDSRSNVDPLPLPAGPDGNWNIDDNWWDNLNNNFIPDYNVGEGEQAYIENGGTAYVDTVGGIDPGRIILGNLGGTSGGLEIRAGGTLNVQEGPSTNGGITVGGSGTGTVEVLPGGTLTATGPIAVFENSSVSVGGLSGGTATLTGGSATIRSDFQVYPNAAVSTTGTVSFTGTGNYQVEIAGDGMNGSISAGSSVTQGGNLNLNFNSYTPSGGDSWTILEANTLLGNFNSITSNATLASNQALVLSKPDLGSGRVGLQASVEEVIVLQVNRDTGSVTMTHPGSATITLDGYYIGSNGGLLSDNPADWTSLTEGNQLGSDWVEQAQTVNNIGELKIGADATFNSDISLGNIYNPLAGTFGQDAEDLEFSFRRSSDSAVIPGIIEYTGITVNNLLLQVDPSGSGDVFLRNTSNTTVELDGYEILSESGSLSTTGWNSLDDQNATSNEWLEALNNSANVLAEFDSEGFTTIAPGASLNLGSLYTGGAEDLEFNFLMMGEDAGIAGTVVYDTPADLPGDFNQDNKVDLGDYTVWRDNLGAPSLPNDNELGTVGADHYELWKSQFGEAATAALATSSAPVPEPATWIAASLAIGLAYLRRKQQ